MRAIVLGALLGWCNVALLLVGTAMRGNACDDLALLAVIPSVVFGTLIGAFAKGTREAPVGWRQLSIATFALGALWLFGSDASISELTPLPQLVTLAGSLLLERVTRSPALASTLPTARLR